MKGNPESLDRVLGYAITAGMVVGFAGLIAAVAAFFSTDWVGTGVCLAASGLAFGLVANALLRR
jgi:hypothetical protein